MWDGGGCQINDTRNNNSSGLDFVKYYTSQNIDMILYQPVLKRYWRQHELWDGTYTFEDLIDICEAIMIKEANKGFIYQHETEKAKAEAELARISKG